MANRAKDNYTRIRKPVIYLVCEGRNKTERIYFNHFIIRESNYTLRIVNSEATDILSLGRKGRDIWQKNQLDKRLGDRVFCLFDIDLDKNKITKLEEGQKRFKNVEFIASNPCFEAWLLFYFTEHPNRVSSSKEEKEQMKRYIPNYTESTDVLATPNLPDHLTVIDRARKCSELQKDISLVDKNPYTEVPKIVLTLIAMQETTRKLIENM